jgi:hypothetical protein
VCGCRGAFPLTTESDEPLKKSLKGSCVFLRAGLIVDLVGNCQPPPSTLRRVGEVGATQPCEPTPSPDVLSPWRARKLAQGLSYGLNPLRPQRLSCTFNHTVPAQGGSKGLRHRDCHISAGWSHAQLRPILCGSGQDLQTHAAWGSRAAFRAFTCVAADGTTDDVSLAVLGPLYCVVLMAVFVAAYFGSRKGHGPLRFRNLRW